MHLSASEVPRQQRLDAVERRGAGMDAGAGGMPDPDNRGTNERPGRRCVICDACSMHSHWDSQPPWRHPLGRGTIMRNRSPLPAQLRLQLQCERPVALENAARKKVVQPSAGQRAGSPRSSLR